MVSASHRIATNWLHESNRTHMTDRKGNRIMYTRGVIVDIMGYAYSVIRVYGRDNSTDYWYVHKDGTVSLSTLQLFDGESFYPYG